MAEARLQSLPWEGTPSQGAEVAAAGSPRLVTSSGRTPLVWSAPVGAGVAASFPFSEAGQQWQAWHLPCSSQAHEGPQDLSLSWSQGDEQGEVLQSGMVCRADPQNPISDKLSVLIRRVVRAFQELAHGKAEHPLDILASGITRRNWRMVREVWLEPELGEPRMSLIVRLALDTKLHALLESIAFAPRQVLARVRQETRMDRVRELDAVCLRDYARRPGRTPVEKAGARQSLLSVQRLPNRDTLENRVTCWVLEALHTRGGEWSREHRSAAGSQRAQAVSRLVRRSATWRQGECLSPVSAKALHHPVQPNYPLQMDGRYRRIQELYRLLYREKRVEDEAWTWRHVLWSQAARQLLAGALVGVNHRDCNAPYFWHEQDRGQWLAPQSSPSPIDTAGSEAYWIDAADVQHYDWLKIAPRTWLKEIGRLGCECILWWPDRDAVLVVWPILWTGGAVAPGSLVEGASQAVQAFKKQHAPHVQIHGLILGSHAASTTQLDARKDVTAVYMPMSFDQGDEAAFRALCKDLRAAIQLAIEASHG